MSAADLVFGTFACLFLLAMIAGFTAAGVWQVRKLRDLHALLPKEDIDP